MPENITEPIFMSTLPVDPRTVNKWAEWRKTTTNSQATLFEKMLLHCVKTDFDPRTAPMEWEGQG